MLTSPFRYGFKYSRMNSQRKQLIVFTRIVFLICICIADKIRIKIVCLYDFLFFCLQLVSSSAQNWQHLSTKHLSMFVTNEGCLSTRILIVILSHPLILCIIFLICITSLNYYFFMLILTDTIVVFMFILKYIILMSSLKEI